jgi:putative transposase
MNALIKVGSRWCHGERTVEIDGPINAKYVQVRVMATGELISAAMHELRPVPQLTLQKRKDPSVVEQPEWERALALSKAFEPFLEQSHLPKKIARSLSQRWGMSVRQILRYRARYQRSQITTALVRSKGGRPKGLRCISVKVERVISHVIEKIYLRREGATQTEICERVRLICKRLHLRVGDKTVVRRIHDLDAYHAASRRQGVKAAKQRFAARPGKLLVLHPLQLVQIDHTLVDLLLVSQDDPNEIIGRPWLTLAIDVATRSVIGYYLSMHAPCSISVAMCLAHVMSPKLENSGGDVMWPMYGVPIGVLVDNGRDFRSAALERGCEQHGIELKWRPVKEPHYGGHIERLMGTFMNLVHTLPGTTFSNTKQRGDYPSEKRACFTLADFRDWLVEKICHHYHVSHHRTLGTAPNIAWERAFQLEDGSYALPEAPVDREDLCCDFFPFEYRRLQRTGVEFKRSRYYHSSLSPLIPKEPTVRVHYDRDNLSKVWIRTAANVLIEASAVAGAALKEGLKKNLSEAEKDRLDKLKHQGYENVDAIRHTAEKRRKEATKVRHKAPPQHKKTRKGVRDKAAADESKQPTVELNRTSVRAEVIEP